MTAGMRRYAACDTDLSVACLEELIDACDIEIVTSPGTGEENTCRSAAFKPVFGKQVKILFLEYCVSVNPALGFPNMNGHVGTRDVIIVKMNHF